MKKTMKQIVSCLLLVCLLVSMVPTTVGAEESNSAEINNGALSVEGTNSFGTLLSEEIQQQQETAYSGDYNIVSLTVEDGVATVEYDSLEAANLVVSLYTENGDQLLASGKTVVQPGSEKAQVEIEGTMPEYFLATAYLLDDYDYSPLCQAYETPMYTREMQQLLESDVNDYDADKVLNLDADAETNFAVYADTTKVIDYVDGVNTVAGVDDATATYVIENADSQITGLQPGDVFAYAYAEDKLLIAKVASIKKSGTTVTITGADLEMEEVFSQVKIENTGGVRDVEVDESTADGGVIFEGFPYVEMDDPRKPLYSTRFGTGGEETISESLEYTLKKEAKNQSGTGKVTLDGTLNLGVKLTFSYYVSFSRQYMELRTDANMALNVTVTGDYADTIALGEIGYTPIPAVKIVFKPEILLSFSGKIELNVTMDMAVGFAFDNSSGFRPINKKPKPEVRLDGNISIYIGFDFKPTIEIIDGYLLTASASIPMGATLDAKLCGKVSEGTEGTGDSVHKCNACVDMDITFTLKLSALLQFFKMENLTYKTPVKKFELGSVDLYWSLDHNEFGEGTCPHKTYRVTVSVQNAQGKAALDVDVYAAFLGNTEQIPLGKTNSNGIVTTYLSPGTYTFRATIDGKEYSKGVTVDGACKVTLNENSGSGKPGFTADMENLPITDYGMINMFGYCGAEGDNVRWTLYMSGALVIDGIGAMEDYNSYDARPWQNYYEKIQKIVIGDNVTSIGDLAFHSCVNLTRMTIPDSVTTIGDRAFQYCYNLTSVTIPDSVTTIGEGAFHSCTSLTSVTIPDSVTTIGGGAFSQCTSLTNVTIPDSVTTIGTLPFLGCTSLAYNTYDIGKYLGNAGNPYLALVDTTSDSITQCNIHPNTKVIGGSAFAGCKSLTSVTIPDSVITINEGAFYCCWDLINMTIGNSVITIGEEAFYYCTSLTSVTIPDSVTTIGYKAFYSCENLTRVTIGNSVTTIGDYAFSFCDGLTDVVFLGSAPSIDDEAFRNTTTTCHYPAGDSSWASVVGKNYGGSVTWVPYSSITAVTAAPAAPIADKIKFTENTVVDAVYGGEYETLACWRTASFKDLVPGKQYTLLALKQVALEDPLQPDNLRYIKQAAAADDGTLTFTYVHPKPTDISFVMVCGASDKDLQDATITVPDLYANEELRVVNPTVVYDGKTLEEGVDYVLAGKVDYTEAGQYTCYIRGIYDYTGTVELTYTVHERGLPGDTDGNETLDTNDAVYLLLHIMFGEEDYPLPDQRSRDYNGDGRLDTNDAVYLLLHVMFGAEDYPLAV